MMENLNKNLVDQDEYPAAQDIHERCVVSTRLAGVIMIRIFQPDRLGQHWKLCFWTLQRSPSTGLWAP